MTAKSFLTKISTDENFYPKFDSIDGSHPYQDVVPKGFVSYKVRELGYGNIAYFNYILAKEMGLIPEDHPHTMNADLRAKLIETFSIQIINEYDELSKKRIPENAIKHNKYMATRYLQLQHTNKQGKTSGDGRSIWNGCLQYKNKVWDISSRGTGVTCLAPGAVEASKPLKTGAGEFGYGNGQAEIDELYSSAIMAEIMHLQGFSTERVLCVIDIGRGYGIGVRAAPNLFRPAHLFMFLKQDRLKELTDVVDFIIERQVQNKEWNINLEAPKKQQYDEMLHLIASSFSQFSAKLERDYIFAWLDWDGDNVLMNAGIIDYGSIRQFGLRHDEYRYDDVERFSTTLKEQKQKARLLVQVFAQMVDYLKTGTKKPLQNFYKHPALKQFKTEFNFEKKNRLLYQMGFNQEQRQNLLTQKPQLVQEFETSFQYFEKVKVQSSPHKVPDGVNHSPLFNMRSVLKSYSHLLAKNPTGLNLEPFSFEYFVKNGVSQFAKTKDFAFADSQNSQIEKFNSLYLEIMRFALGSKKNSLQIKNMAAQSGLLNSEKRITGNALIQIVDELMTQLKKGPLKKGLTAEEMQGCIDKIILQYLEIPEVKKSRFFKQDLHKPTVRSDIFSRILKLVADHHQDI